MNRIGIKGNLIFLVIFMLVFMVGMGSFTFSSLNSTLNQGQNDVATVNKYIDLVDKSRNIQVNFKKQVQAWKDLLLSGLDKSNYDTYMTEFTGYNKDVLTGLDEIKTSMSSLGIDVASVDKVSTEVNQLQSNYINALKNYDMNNKDSYKIVYVSSTPVDLEVTATIASSVIYVIHIFLITYNNKRMQTIIL